MPERIFQHRFTKDFEPAAPVEITPGSEAEDVEAGEVSLGRDVREVPEKIHLGSPDQAAQYLAENIFTPFEECDQEEMWVLMLDNRNRVTHERMVYRGNVDRHRVRTAEVLKEAVKLNAPRIVMAHNHPSGKVNPSPEDYEITKGVEAAAEILDIALMDHLIIGEKFWCSLRKSDIGHIRTSQ